jgi:hypothetical protein
MGSARGSSPDPNSASGMAHPPLPSWMRPVPPSGIAPALGLWPATPFSIPEARRLPLFSTQACLRDRQASYLPLTRRVSRRGHGQVQRNRLQ